MNEKQEATTPKLLGDSVAKSGPQSGPDQTIAAAIGQAETGPALMAYGLFAIFARLLRPALTTALALPILWGLALAHRRLQGPCRRSFELEQRVLQLMRGLMRSMMRQSAMPA